MPAAVIDKETREMRKTLTFLLRAAWWRAKGRKGEMPATKLDHERLNLYADGTILPVMAGGEETPEEQAERERQERDATEEREREERERAQNEWPEEAQRALQRANDEAARRRHELRDAERERDRLAQDAAERENAERSELERANARIEELESDVGQSTSQLRRAYLLTELVNPDLEIAVDAIDLVADALQVDYSDDHRPVDVAAAVQMFLEARPSLRRHAPAPTSSPSNPGGGRQRGGTMTREEVATLARDDPDRFNTMYDAGEIPAAALGG